MEAILETNENAKRSGRSFALRMIWFLMKCALVIGTTVTAAHYVTLGTQIATSRVEAAYDSFLKAVTRTETVREFVRPEAVPIKELITAVAREQRVPVVALEAIVDQESSGGKRLYNFEPRKYEELRGRVRDNEDEIRMLASSHGPAHVMGFNAKTRCGVTWDRLYDTYTGINYGAKILRQNLDRYKDERDTSMRLYFAFRDYNGSGEDAKQYATEVMARVGKLLYSQIKTEM